MNQFVDFLYFLRCPALLLRDHCDGKAVCLHERNTVCMPEYAKVSMNRRLFGKPNTLAQMPNANTVRSIHTKKQRTFSHGSILPHPSAFLPGRGMITPAFSRNTPPQRSSTS